MFARWRQEAADKKAKQEEEALTTHLIMRVMHKVEIKDPARAHYSNQTTLHTYDCKSNDEIVSYFGKASAQCSPQGEQEQQKQSMAEGKQLLGGHLPMMFAEPGKVEPVRTTTIVVSGRIDNKPVEETTLTSLDALKAWLNEKGVDVASNTIWLNLH